MKEVVVKFLSMILIGAGAGLMMAILLTRCSVSPPQEPDIEIEEPQLVPDYGFQDTSIRTKVIKNIDINFNRTVYLTSVVTALSVDTLIHELKVLDQDSGPIWLLIDSPGGSVFDGERVLSTLQSARNPVYTVCTSLCASMAAIIESYGTKRYAYDRASIMFHDASGGLQGPIMHMHTMLSFIQKKLRKTNSYIANRARMSYDDFMQLQVKDLWIDAEDAKNVGLIDDIIAVKVDTRPGRVVMPSIVEETIKKKTSNDDTVIVLPYLE